MKTHKLLACLLALWLGQALAHGGEDHGVANPAAAIASNQPQRLPDGSVFVPKDVQRRLAIRTVVGEEKAVPRTVELNGHVVMDPNAGGRVQAIQSGRIEGGPKGLPVAGMKVVKGQVLGYVVPAVTSVERASQSAELADLRAKARLAEKQLARLRELSGTVAKKEIEAQEAELAGLRQRAAALGAATGREALRAPVSGVIAQASVVSGQVVEARDVLFEIVDPARLMIEAQAYDAGLVAALTGASLAGTQTPLAFVGGASALRDGALPVLFRLQQAGATPLALGQAVKVIAQTRDTVQGVPLPAASVVRNAANESIVWVHERAEVFRGMPVRVTPLDGANVVATGLKPGVRVVSQGATLINQIR
ncbi:efflux RND transporter periplasmic adaptor subunit [Pseudogulbenkiania sp. MAI-1]|uniref:efflux RND transporter periplasmic adaptor subunit n=1 Tax=Pseudogulbenkiania sp. MAI-1 TaxID=990370 RepID=UPI00045E9DE4|nr:HlyD family efflux transporter periplasmic adaptor subunit [Pseudogulbenkiania sp. MAI-1]